MGFLIFTHKMKLSLTIFFCYGTLILFGQTDNYINYTRSEGLPSNMVYCIEQDVSGYIWIGTDVGLSRFDGRSFKNFTTDDGLPDNEIINFFKDSRDRIWMYTINGKVGYIHQGRIYTSKNTPELTQLDGNYQVVDIVEFDSAVYISNGKVSSFKSFQPKLLEDLPYGVVNYLILREDSLHIIGGSVSGSIANGKLKKRYDENLELFRGYWHHVSVNSYEYISYASMDKLIVFNPSTWTYNLVDIGVNATLYNIKKIGEKVFLMASDGLYQLIDHSVYKISDIPEVSNLFFDNEGNKWIATLTGGVYFQAAQNVFPDRSITESVEALKVANNKLHAFLTDGRMMVHETNKWRQHGIFPQTGGIKDVEINGDGQVWVAGRKKSYFPGFIFDVTVIKNVELVDDEYVFSTPHCLFRLPKGGRIDYISRVDFAPRSARFFYYNESDIQDFQIFSYDSILIAGRNGLFTYLGDSLVNHSHQNPLLGSRMVDLEVDQNFSAWIAADGIGLIKYDGSNTMLFNQEQGLLDNFCQKILSYKNKLYVASKEGITIIDTQTDQIYGYIHEENGLIGERLFSMEVFNDSVYVGTDMGLFHFDANLRTIKQTEIPIYFESLVLDFEEREIVPKLELSHEVNNIEVGFAAVHFADRESLIYRYKLLSGDNQSPWFETGENQLRFSRLKPDQYELMVQAKTRNTPWSPSASLIFSIKPPYYQTWWFLAGCFLVSVSVTLLIYRAIKRNQRIKEKLAKDRINSEMKALKAQINPHFLFNALSSIQHFVVEDQKHDAEQYLTDYSVLIRKVLDHSNKLLVTMNEELETLKLYTEIEKLRTDGKFEVYFDTQGVDEYMTTIPSMIIQPIIENAIWHGLMPKNDKGNIWVKFRDENGIITVTIKDDGVGFDMNQKNKSTRKSYGTSLVKDRIKLLTKFYEAEFDMVIKSEPNVGTEVNIKFPNDL